MAVRPKEGNKGHAPKRQLAPNAGFRAFPVTDAASKGSPKKGERGPMGASGGRTSPKTGMPTKGRPKSGRRG